MDEDTVDVSEWLAAYLRTHATGAAGGVRLFERTGDSLRDAHARSVIRPLAAQVAQDRAALHAIMDRLGVRRDLLAEALAVVGERLGALKPNGRLVRRSPLSDLIELEALTIALHGQERGWTALREVSDRVDGLDPLELDRLADGARAKQVQVEAVRRRVAASVLAPDGEQSAIEEPSDG